MISVFVWNQVCKKIEVFADSDTTVCTVTRKPTPGGILAVVKDIIKSLGTAHPFIYKVDF